MPSVSLSACAAASLPVMTRRGFSSANGSVRTFPPYTGTVPEWNPAPNSVLMHYATGLADGNHTVALHTNAGASPGTLIANNPRR